MDALRQGVAAPTDESFASWMPRVIRDVVLRRELLHAATQSFLVKRETQGGENRTLRNASLLPSSPAAPIMDSAAPHTLGILLSFGHTFSAFSGRPEIGRLTGSTLGSMKRVLGEKIDRQPAKGMWVGRRRVW